MSTHVFRVPAVGTGTEEDPIRPDLPPAPAGGSWEAVHQTAGDFIIRTNYVPADAPRAVELAGSDLDAECAACGLEVAAVLARVWPEEV